MMPYWRFIGIYVPVRFNTPFISATMFTLPAQRIAKGHVVSVGRTGNCPQFRTVESVSKQPIVVERSMSIKTFVPTQYTRTKWIPDPLHNSEDEEPRLVPQHEVYTKMEYCVTTVPCDFFVVQYTTDDGVVHTIDANMPIVCAE